MIFTRQCRRCRRVKPIEEFRVSTVKGARRRECKDCQKKAWKEYREKHRLDWNHVQRRRFSQAEYASRNVEKRREYQKTYQRAYRQRQKDLRHGRLVDHGTSENPNE